MVVVVAALIQALTLAPCLGGEVFHRAALELQGWCQASMTVSPGAGHGLPALSDPSAAAAASKHR